MRRRVGLLSVALLALFLAGVSGPEGQTVRAGPPARLEPATLKLKWKHQFQSAGYYAAVEQGYYADAGLVVQIEEATDQEESVEAVLSGLADFGVAASDLVVARAKGQPIVVLAAIFQHSPTGLLVRQDSGIGSVHDLVGKRVMLEPHSEEILAYLQAEGMSSDEWVQYPHAFDPLPLIRGEVDAMSAYITDEPFLLEEAGVPYSFFSPRAGGIDFYGDTLFTSEEMVRKHPERVSAFLRASRQGWAYAFEDEDAVIDLILDKYSTRHTREHLKYEAEKMRDLVLPDVVEVGYMNPGRWERIAETYVELGVLSEKPEMEGFLYDESARSGINWTYMVAGGAIAIVALIGLLVLEYGSAAVIAMGRKLLARRRGQ